MSVPPEEKQTSEKWLFSCDSISLCLLKGTEDEAGHAIWDAFTESPSVGYMETGISWHYTSSQPKPDLQSTKNVSVQSHVFVMSSRSPSLFPFTLMELLILS